MAESERLLGFAIPEPLRSIYATVANGGFGPEYGVLGICEGATDDRGHTAVDGFLEYRQADPDDVFWAWPNGLLPFLHLGCAMYLCVNATDASGGLIWFEPNPHAHGTPWNDSFVSLPFTFTQWLEGWLDGRDLFGAIVAAECT